MKVTAEKKTMRQKFLILVILIGLCNHGCGQKLEISDATFLPNLVNVVKENHLDPKVINNQLSIEIFNSFISRIDPEKKIFTAQEINELRLEEETLDESFQTGTNHFLNKTIVLHTEGIERAKKNCNQFLNSNLSLFEDVLFETNTAKIYFANNETILINRWESIVKNRFIQDLWIVEETKPNLTFKAQKEVALEKARYFFASYFDRISSRTREKLLEIYANSYVSNNDYQSEFLFLKSKAEWDAKFDRSFVGVGVVIETTLDYPKVTNIVVGGPAWKGKKIKKGDSFIKISNDENEFIDVAGFPLKKVIDLLKGKEGSKVKVIIKNSENIIEEVEIERGSVPMSKAMSFILKEASDNKKIGYISLPRFYGGNEGCASHVLKELHQLKENNVDGIVFDLRNNQGGSAREAIKIMGYFLSGGVVMQAKYANGNHKIFEDEGETAIYTGKLIILINERSSSASELFAGTMQDYKRAVIVGSQTYGKGTIQRFFEVIDVDKLNIVGEVKLSIGSFYTALGRSTQYDGITPDIILPSKKMYIKTGERSVENALKFENIDSKKVNTFSITDEYLAKLIVLSKNRQLKNDYWLGLHQEAKRIEKKQVESLINLNYSAYKLKKDSLKEIKVDLQKIKDFLVIDVSSNAYEQERKEHWKNKIENDCFVYESLLIAKDCFIIE